MGYLRELHMIYVPRPLYCCSFYMLWFLTLMWLGVTLNSLGMWLSFFITQAAVVVPICRCIRAVSSTPCFLQLRCTEDRKTEKSRPNEIYPRKHEIQEKVRTTWSGCFVIHQAECTMAWLARSLPLLFSSHLVGAV
ncbi:hypothetical protein BO78DRAFT_79129 [Aspergillus sclerotiicarbonarius CBS 121057]|uniref:Uncharacterized protein n=1 Tax=Aspergillus sclerotiicarbonarius (strain CBS 121057 / IBT 28362) TaxID=1448318 RepID=A0A319EK45_ASPSB|nr:hypothetical protein BO78DRAFT_79129 [Aspergillus sclerotiicarbonarius CBS 121057]